MHILFFFLGEGVREEIFQTARGLRFGSQITRRTTDTSVIPHGTGPLAVSGTAPVLPQSTMCCHKAPLAISRTTVSRQSYADTQKEGGGVLKAGPPPPPQKKNGVLFN